MNKKVAKKGRGLICTSMAFLSLAISVPGIFSSDWFGLFGARIKEEFVWQYFSFMFVHGAPENLVTVTGHLALNLVILFEAGKTAERLIGSRHLAWMSILSLVGYWMLQQPFEVTVNGLSGVIWSYSSVLFMALMKQKNEELIAKETARMWIGIMWLGVSVFMTIVPYLFGSNLPVWQAFLYGNLFHAQAVLTGFLYLLIVGPPFLQLHKNAHNK